ncbi:hypothetical protein LCGC14_3037130 [marine sediment metagenome]|uniref:Uncharacterized protein n=1 Tax=marine sediment metagenome TaxID=412755 RepID=A0A0F8XDX6_9ZZZZ
MDHPLGYHGRRGIGTIEEQRRNRQSKRRKKSPRDRIYRPFSGYIRNPDKNRPPEFIFIHDALLMMAGHLIIENWLDEEK